LQHDIVWDAKPLVKALGAQNQGVEIQKDDRSMCGEQRVQRSLELVREHGLTLELLDLICR
jgi:hypothetical protein